MNDFSCSTEINIKRFQNLLRTSVDETERQTIQRLLSEEEAGDLAGFGAEEGLGNKLEAGFSPIKVLV